MLSIKETAMRWFLLDSDIVGDGFTALCYENDALVEHVHFDDRWAANDYGEQWMHTETDYKEAC